MTNEDFKETYKYMPIPYNNGFILPLGWEFELQNRNITFEVINYVNLEEEI